MFICIDLERLCVLYKHQNQNALVSLANIEVPSSAIVVMSATELDSYERFTDYELKVLFNNLCGMQHNGYHRKDIVQSVARLVGMLQETELNAAEIEAQLACVPTGSEDSYRYQYGSKIPANQPELFQPDAMVTVPGHKPANKRYYVRDESKVQKYIANPGINPFIKEPDAPTPRDPNAPKEIAARPKAGSTTERVWVISDECYARHPHMDKTLRSMVAEECTAAGINPSTMSVQHSKWRGSKTAS